MNGIILSIVKQLQGIRDDTQDALLSIYVDMAVQTVLDYTNRNDFPEGLKYVAADMVINELKINAEPDESLVSSISEGGASVSFNTGLTQARFEQRVKNTSMMNQYRLPYKINRNDR